jgi:peptidyl-prolyl cis-trans isomerase C
MPRHLSLPKIALWLLVGALLIAACGAVTEVPTPASATPPPSPAPPTGTPTPVLPTPTPVPLAARVNGEEITQAEFEEELARFQAASEQGGETSETEPEARQRVLDELVDQVLLAQSAREAGFSLTDNELQARLDALAKEAGGEQALAAWQADNGYSPESFLKSFERSLASAWMRDQVITAVPETGEQVHARQILLHNEDQAREVLARLGAGEDFEILAVEFEPVTFGDLGWFPRGYLLEPALEEAVFALEPGAYSRVVETRVGFHLIHLIERTTDRPLDPDARLALQRKALREWLDTRRSESEIQTLLPE